MKLLKPKQSRLANHIRANLHLRRKQLMGGFKRIEPQIVLIGKRSHESRMVQLVRRPGMLRPIRPQFPQRGALIQRRFDDAFDDFGSRISDGEHEHQRDIDDTFEHRFHRRPVLPAPSLHFGPRQPQLAVPNNVLHPPPPILRPGIPQFTSGGFQRPSLNSGANTARFPFAQRPLPHRGSFTNAFPEGTQGFDLPPQQHFPGMSSHPAGSGGILGSATDNTGEFPASFHNTASGLFLSRGGVNHNSVGTIKPQDTVITPETTFQATQPAHVDQSSGTLSGINDHLHSFDGFSNSDGFINGNIKSVETLIAHAEPVFESDKKDGFLQEPADIKDTFREDSGMSNVEMENPIKGLELLGNSRWDDILKELASVSSHGMSTDIDINGESVVVYPVNPYASGETRGMGIPGDGVTLVPVVQNPASDMGHTHVGPFGSDALDSRPSGLGQDAFAVLGIDPRTLEAGPHYLPKSEIVTFEVSADKLAPEHPPPIPLPGGPKPETSNIVGIKKLSKPPVDVKQSVPPSENTKTNLISPSFLNDGLSALGSFIAAEAVAKTLDEIGT